VSGEMGAYSERKIAIQQLKELTKNAAEVLIIHYSQLLIHDADTENISPLISAIVIRSIDDSIYEHFAIHLEADKSNIQKDEIKDNYNELEFFSLKAFNNFLKRHKDKLWVHWEMKNIHFGFEAIKHRFDKYVEGTKENFEIIPINNKINLNYLLECIYGDDYVDGPDKLYSLMKVNKILSDREYLSLDREATEFENGNYKSILKSLDFKVDFIRKVIDKLWKKKLKIQNKNYYSRFQIIVTHPLFTFLGWLVGIIIGIISII
jgi:hypothetical protein